MNTLKINTTLNNDDVISLRGLIKQLCPEAGLIPEGEEDINEIIACIKSGVFQLDGRGNMNSQILNLLYKINQGIYRLPSEIGEINTIIESVGGKTDELLQIANA